MSLALDRVQWPNVNTENHVSCTFTTENGFENRVGQTNVVSQPEHTQVWSVVDLEHLQYVINQAWFARRWIVQRFA